MTISLADARAAHCEQRAERCRGPADGSPFLSVDNIRAVAGAAPSSARIAAMLELMCLSSESKSAMPSPVRRALLPSTRRQLTELRKSLLVLHKTLLDLERIAYEREHGRTTAGELLQLVLKDAHFAWLHALSELIVRIDELLDAEEQPDEAEAQQLLTQTRLLLSPVDNSAPFSQRYYAILQREPAAVVAHGAIGRVLASPGDEAAARG